MDLQRLRRYRTMAGLGRQGVSVHGMGRRSSQPTRKTDMLRSVDCDFGALEK